MVQWSDMLTHFPLQIKYGFKLQQKKSVPWKTDYNIRHIVYFYLVLVSEIASISTKNTKQIEILKDVEIYTIFTNFMKFVKIVYLNILNFR